MRNATAAPPIRHTVASTVRAELARAGVSQSAAARWIGVTQPAMSARLHARVPFTVDELYAIAEGLELPIETLLGEQPDFRVPAATGAPQRNRTHGTATRLRSDVRPITDEYWDKWYGYPLRAAA